jgi:hypothetical protein
MFRWNKLGKIFDPGDTNSKSWMHQFAQSPSVIIMDACVRVFFCTRPAIGLDGKYISYIAYIDLDRNNLFKILYVCKKPVLELGKYGTFDEFGTNPVSVIRAGNEIRAYYAGWTRCESVPFNAAIGLAVSRDGGESFTRLGDGPVLSYTFDEPFLLGSPRIRNFSGLWQLFYVAGREWIVIDGKPEPVYKIRMASSEDGINWLKCGQDLIGDKLGPQECQACPDVTYHNGKFHMFFSYRDVYNYKDGCGGYQIGYASSLDMLNWQRHDDLLDIRLSDSGWDSEMISYPHLFNLEGRTHMFYQGNGMGRDGFGLAVLEDEAAWGTV